MLSDAEYRCVLILFRRYKEIIVERRDEIPQMPQKCAPDHLVRLCNEALDNAQNYPFDKLSRWIGFIQGVLCANGVIDVDEERNYSRPLLHAIHSAPVRSFG